MGHTATLLMTCQDKKGLVYKISDFIFRHRGNILHADQHIDFKAGRFFSRVEWDLAECGLSHEQIKDDFRPLAESLGMDWNLRFSTERPRVALFVSKLDHCLRDLLDRQSLGELAADFVVIVSNHENMRPVAEQYQIPYHVFPITRESKPAQEARELALLASLNVDLIRLLSHVRSRRTPPNSSDHGTCSSSNCHGCPS